MLTDQEKRDVEFREYWTKHSMDKLFTYSREALRKTIASLCLKNSQYFPDNSAALGGFLFMSKTYKDPLWTPREDFNGHFPPLASQLVDEGWHLDEMFVTLERQEAILRMWFGKIFYHCLNVQDIRNVLPDNLCKEFNELSIARTKELDELKLIDPDFKSKINLIERLLVLKLMV